MSGTAPDLLRAIVAATRRRVETASEVTPLDRLKAVERTTAGGLRRALSRTDRPNVIAECKRRSPSRGVLRWTYDAAAIARGYEKAGAAAISVLSEPTFFDGSLDHVSAVRGAVSLPVLRKDFTVDPYQIWEARAAGADAILLIVAALDDAELLSLLAEARDASLDALVEVHDEEELGRALAAGADLVGVNNRNLRTLAVDLDTSRRLAPRIPPGIVAVAESGLRTGADLRELRAIGYRAFLVGERFMSSDDPGLALSRLIADAESGGDDAPRASGDGSRGVTCA